MNKGQLEELKSFITSTISESEQRLRIELKEFIEDTVSKAVLESEQRLRVELKEFIKTTISKAILESEERLRDEFKSEIRGLRAEMQESFRGVAESFEKLEKKQTRADKFLERHTRQLDHHGELILQLQNPV